MKQLLLTHLKKLQGNKLILILFVFAIMPIVILGTNKALLIFFPYLIAMQIFSGLTKLERKIGINQGEDILLNSLPVNRVEIVLSRYIIIFLFGFSCVCLSIAILFIGTSITNKPGTIGLFLFSAAFIQFVYNVIFIPLEYLSSNVSQIIKSIFYILSIGMIGFYRNSNIPIINYIKQYAGTQMSKTIFIALIVLSIPLSVFLSIKIYEKKEF